jgi:hypothetical protein
MNAPHAPSAKPGQALQGRGQRAASQTPNLGWGPNLPKSKILQTWQTRRGNRLSLFEVPQPLRGLYLEVFIFAPSFRIPHAGYSLGIGSPLSSSRLQLRKAHGEQRLQRRKKYLLHVP